LLDANQHWTLLEKLGEGSYGQVYRAKDIHNDTYVAVKIMRLSSNELLHEYENELNILTRLSEQQENLPNFFGIFADKDESHVARIWFVMELCYRGPLTHILKQLIQRNLLNKIEHEKIIAYAMQNILNALNYLHRSGIMHRGRQH
jgi:serine/threonine protein kinase